MNITLNEFYYHLKQIQEKYFIQSYSTTETSLGEVFNELSLQVLIITYYYI